MLQKGDQIAQEDIYVVKNLHRSLLGRPAIEKLHILARIGSVKQSGQSTVDKFSCLFTGLGKLEGDYTIRVKEGAKPFSLSTPRRVPLPLMKPVKKTGQNG